LEIEKRVEVVENVVNGIAADDAALLDGLLEGLEHFQVLHVRSLGRDQFFDDVLPLGALGGAGALLSGRGRRGIGAQHAFLDEDVEDLIDDARDLDEAGGVVAVQVGDHEALADAQVVHACRRELVRGGLAALLLADL
jgi:hypothetical protein